GRGLGNQDGGGGDARQRGSAHGGGPARSESAGNRKRGSIRRGCRCPRGSCGGADITSASPGQERALRGARHQRESGNCTHDDEDRRNKESGFPEGTPPAPDLLSNQPMGV